MHLMNSWLQYVILVGGLLIGWTIAYKFMESLLVDNPRGVRYNRDMRFGDCSRCAKGEHGIESKYTPGTCACCGEETNYDGDAA